MMSRTSIAQEPPTFDATLDNQLGLTFSPDGSTAFWVAWNGAWGSKTASQRIIYMSRYEQGNWSTPTPAPFSREFHDDDPFVSPDGKWLYFVSKRPASRDDKKLDPDIWRFSLIEENRLEHLPINSESAEYSPVVTKSGTLYFASAKDGGMGEGDLYRALPDGDSFRTPELLGPAFNTPGGEWNLWVSADDNEIIFEASSRPTNVSMPGDLYYSWRTPGGWTSAIPINQLNSADSDLMPRLRPNGEILYYTSAPIGGHARIVTANWAQLREQLRFAYAPTLLVANRSSHEVTFVDLSRGEVVARVATGEGPHLLSNVNDDRVLATGYGEFPRPHANPVANRPPFVSTSNSRATLIRTSDQSVLLDRVIEGCAKPHASWIVGQRGYVTCEEEKHIRILDLRNGQTIGQFETLQDGSHVLSFDPESRTLASSNTGPGSATLINIDSGTTTVVKLAAGSEGALAIDGRIWIGNAIDGSVSVVDPNTQAVIHHIKSVCQFPIAFGGGRQQQIWVACFASAELVAIDSEIFVIRRRIKLDEQPLNILTHPDRDLAYVSFPRRNAIGEIDLGSGRELRRLEVGIEPDGLRWASSQRW